MQATSSSSTDQIEFLKTTELFRDVSDGLLAQVHAHMEEHRVSAGTTIFHKGDKGDAIYLVLRGVMRMESDGVPVATTIAGQCFGEMALIDRSPRSATAVAQSDTLLLRWDRESFLQVISREPRVAYGIFKMLSGKLRHDTEIMVDLQLEQGRWRQDLRRAREIQMGMLPPREFDSGSIEIAGYCRPAAEVGGDYYDYLCFDDDQLGLIIGDVTGHGFYAGLFVAMAKSCLNTQVRVDFSPRGVMEAMARTLTLSIQRSLLMSCAYVVFDPRRNRLSFCNAGHPHPYHYRRKHERLEMLEPTDPLLGVQDLYDSGFAEEEREWGSGDLLVVYSDGITEARNADGRMFEDGILKQCIVDSRDRSAAQVRESILEALYQHCGQRVAHSDDLTLVVARANH